MSNNIKLTVIVPVYNVEKYLEKTLNCIVNQSMKEIEILLIDDSSTDNSLKIMEQAKRKDERIDIIKLQTNQGSSIARNIGLDFAKGEYVTFFDSDDMFALDMLERMYNLAIQEDCCIVTCGFSEVSLKGDVYFNFEAPTGFIKKDLDMINLPVVPWNKIYKKSLFDDIKFPEYLLHQDYGTIPIILAKSKKIYHINQLFVKHIVHKESVTYKSLTVNDTHAYDVIINSKRLIENEYMIAHYESATNIYPLITSGIASKINRYIINNDILGLEEYFNKVNEILPKYIKEVKGKSINQKIFIFFIKKRAYFLLFILMKLRKNHYTG